MRWPVVILALLLVLPGTLFFFQGIGVIGGSFMSSQSIWAVIGGAMVLAGAALIVFGMRRASPK